MRLDYLSPLPPVRSGISDYSVDLLPHLAARPEVDDLRVVRLPDQPVADAVAARFRPVSWEAFREDAAGRLPLYQMGNNHHHEAVLTAARERPGVLTLHDLVIHHQLLGMTLGRSDDLAPYETRLRADHGWMGGHIARAKLWGAYGELPSFAFPARRSLLRRQRGVLVHSRWAADEIREEDPEIRVRAVPMGVPLPPPIGADEDAAGRALRERLGIPAGAPLLGSMGFQTPIKRTDAVVRALARPGLEDAHLVVVGEVSTALDLEGVARNAGVADRVHVTGFVPFEELEAAITACDLCCNLRYPSAGETSASLLRILAVGRPVVVSDYAQFAELPPDVAVRVPLPFAEGGALDQSDEDDPGVGAEAVALARAVGELLASPERLAAMGAAARQHVAREHAPERAAAAVAQACADWADAAPPGDPDEDREGAAWPAPTSVAWNDLPWRLDVTGGDDPWPVGERRRLELTLTNTGRAVWRAGGGAGRDPGGVAVEVGWRGAATPEPVRPWLPLPHDVGPGESVTFRVELRKPPSRDPDGADLAFRPHRLGAGGGAF